MKLTTLTFISLDGVVQGPGGADEDTRNGFERGGWVAPFFDDEGGAHVVETIGRADAFLFGRWTYDLFTDYWGPMSSDHPIAGAFNTKPKYVASNSSSEAAWEGSTHLDGDLAEAVRELKSQGDGELQVHGSCTLVRWLVENQLVDEMTLMVMPVVIGQGQRLFGDPGEDNSFELISSRTTPTGVAIQTFGPAGKPTYGDVEAEGA